MNMDIVSDNISLNSSVSLPVLSNDVHIASGTFEISSSYFLPLLGNLESNTLVPGLN